MSMLFSGKAAASTATKLVARSRTRASPAAASFARSRVASHVPARTNAIAPLAFQLEDFVSAALAVVDVATQRKDERPSSQRHGRFALAIVPPPSSGAPGTESPIHRV